MAVAITSDAVTKPIIEIVLSGGIRRATLGETMVTDDGTYKLVQIGCPELYAENEVGISFKWQRIRNLPHG